METDVVIIGAGALGVSLAFHLSNQGTRVVLLERESLPAAHSSGKNAGMIRHLYRHPQLTEWTKRSIALWPDEISKKFFRTTGSVIIGRSAPFHHTDLFSDTVYRKPDSGEDLKAVYTAADGLLDSVGYVNALYSMLDRKFASAFFNTSAASVQRCSGYWEVRTEDGRMFYSQWLVNAAGAWLNSFLEPHYPWLCVEAKPYARHLFMVHGWEKDYMPATDCGFFWDEQAGWYLRRWDSDTRLVSICDRTPTEESGQFSDSAASAEHVAVTLIRELPGVGETLRVGRFWKCFRTYAADMLPIFGQDRDISGLFWLAGFGGVGMSASFAASLDAAAIISGERLETPAEFRAERVKITPFPQRLRAAPAASRGAAAGDRQRVVI